MILRLLESSQDYKYYDSYKNSLEIFHIRRFLGTGMREKGLMFFASSLHVNQFK